MREILSLRRDTAWAAATAAVELVSPVLLPAEAADAKDRFFEVFLAAIETYDLMTRREEIRYVPSRN